MISTLKKLLGKKPLPAKDPDDFTLSKSSTDWWANSYCRSCKNSVGHNEFMAHVCNSCGSGLYTYSGYDTRSVRKIWNGEKWQYQLKYSHGAYEFKDV